MNSGRGASHNGGTWGSRGGIKWGEMLDIDEGVIEAANHLVMYAAVQQPCMTCTCNPEPKVEKKKSYTKPNRYNKYVMKYEIKE